MEGNITSYIVILGKTQHILRHPRYVAQDIIHVFPHELDDMFSFQSSSVFGISDKRLRIGKGVVGSQCHGNMTDCAIRSWCWQLSLPVGLCYEVSPSAHCRKSVPYPDITLEVARTYNSNIYYCCCSPCGQVPMVPAQVLSLQVTVQVSPVDGQPTVNASPSFLIHVLAGGSSSVHPVTASIHQFTVMFLDRRFQTPVL